MLKPGFLVRMMLISVVILGAGMVLGQNYPTQTVRLITAAPGSGIDFTARLLAQGLAKSLGQPVVVENRSTIISIEAGAKAPSDGYTLLLAGSSLWLLPSMRKVPWDPVKDFAPISLVTFSPLIVVVHPLLPVKSVKDFIALAKARPGELNYGAGAMGALPHLSGELLKSMANINIVLIPYKGTGAAVSDLVGGHLQMVITAAGAVTSLIKSGKLKALAVTSAQPSALFPDLPTVASSGLRGYEVTQLIGLFAPGKTADTIVNRLSQETARFIKAPDTKERIMNAGGETVGSSPEQLTAAMTAEVARMGKVIKDVGIKVE